MTETPNLPATPQPTMVTGLEDFEASDAVHPRLKIVHREAEFEDNLSGGKFKKVRLIILAMNKQRILWYPTVDDNDRPMCRSADFLTGFPTPDEEATKGKEFPWESSGFNPTDYAADEEGQRQLPCAACKLKEWGTHPGNKKTPYCAEQWTLSVLYDGQDKETEEYTGTWSIALMTMQKSGLKAIKSYLTSFQRSKTPAFTTICEVTLTLNNRGQVDYSTPNFRSVGKTDQGMWPEYSEQAEQMRRYLKRTPDPIDNSDKPETSDNSYNAPPSAQAQAEQPQQNDPWASPSNGQPSQPDPWAQPANEQPAAQQSPPVQQQPATTQQQPAAETKPSGLPF